MEKKKKSCLHTPFNYWDILGDMFIFPDTTKFLIRE
jgi:hypothetical protein